MEDDLMLDLLRAENERQAACEADPGIDNYTMLLFSGMQQRENEAKRAAEYVAEHNDPNFRRREETEWSFRQMADELRTNSYYVKE